MSLAVAVPCPTCGRPPETSVDYGVSVSCPNCFDADCVGDPPRYVSRSPHGDGLTLVEAIENWNDSVETSL